MVTGMSTAEFEETTRMCEELKAEGLQLTRRVVRYYGHANA